MGRTPAEKNYFTFNTGLITEGSKLTYVPNSLSDMSNFVIKPNKWIERRRGLDYEVNYAILGNREGVGDYSLPDGSMPAEIPRYRGSHTWISAGGRFGNDFLFLALQDTVICFALGGVSVSPNAIGYIPYGAGGYVSFAAEGEWLVMASSQEAVPVAVHYRDIVSADGGEITGRRIRLKIRDFGLVADQIPPGIRPTMQGNDVSSITQDPMVGYPEHTYGEYLYDLINGGWNVEHINSFRATIGALPARGDVFAIGIDNNSFNPSRFKTSYAGVPTGTTVRGRFILDALSPRRAPAAEEFGYQLGDLPDPTGDELTCAGTYAGRIWYSGKSNRVYYSPQLNDYSSAEVLGQCYQEQDPSAAEYNELLATDGGYFPVAGGGNFTAMRTFGDALLVFNPDGVWAIRGSQGMMNAEDISVKKLSSSGLVGRDSLVSTEGQLYYWGENSIYMVTTDEYGNPIVRNMTEATIHDLFSKITYLGKRESRGTYNPEEQVVQWYYNSALASTDEDDAAAAREVLCFDVRIGAFYPYTISKADAPGWGPAPPPPVRPDPPPICAGRLVKTTVPGFPEAPMVIRNEEGRSFLSVSRGAGTQENRTYLANAAEPVLEMGFTGERVIEFSIDQIRSDAQIHFGVVVDGDRAQNNSNFWDGVYLAAGNVGAGVNVRRDGALLSAKSINGGNVNTWGFGVDGTTGDAVVYLNGAEAFRHPAVFRAGEKVVFRVWGVTSYRHIGQWLSSYLNYSAQKFVVGYPAGTSSWCGNEDASSPEPSPPIPAVAPFVLTPLMLPPTRSSEESADVMVGQDQVFVDDDPVAIGLAVEGVNKARSAAVVYVPLKEGYGITVSSFNSDTLRDWFSYNAQGNDYSSYAEFGYETLDDPKRNKEARNVHLWFKPTESGVYEVTPNSGVMDYKTPSACRLISKWNWATSDVTNMWNDYGDVYQFPVYYSPDIGQTEFTLPYEVIPVQRELTGSGQSVTLRVESEPGMELTLVGWAALYTAENNP